jgi:hypothetical protein
MHQNINRHIHAENQIAAIHSAMAYLDAARHKLTDRIFDRIPAGRLEQIQREVDANIHNAIGDLQRAAKETA